MRAILLMLLFGLTAPARAETGRSVMRFDLRIVGFHAGILDLAATETDSAYAARSLFHTTGLLGALKRLRADLSVQGRVTGGRLQPYDYAEAIDNGRRVTDLRVRFAPGIPRLISGDTGSTAPPADTRRLDAVIDPLTLLYLAVRDQPGDTLCRMTADIFDGHRHARFTLNGRQEQGKTITCTGHYRRIAGYGGDAGKSDDVAISVDYVANGSGWRAARLAVETWLGPAVLERR